MSRLTALSEFMSRTYALFGEIETLFFVLEIAREFLADLVAGESVAEILRLRTDRRT